MKRFLLLLALSAFLAIPAISMAETVVGAGAAPSITVKANTVHSVSTATGTTTAMRTETYTLTKGGFSFTVNDVNPDDQTQGQTFKGQLAFNGPAASTSDPTKTLSNLFINMSGLVLSADKTKSAVIGQGAISGSVVHTDPSDGPELAGFTGAYSMKVSLSGFVTTTDPYGNTSTNPTKGTAVVTVTISGITAPGVVLTVTMPPIPFNILGGTVTGGATTGWALSHDGTTSVLTLSQIGPLVAGTIVDTHDDGTVEIQPISGTIDGSNVTMYVTDTSSTPTNTTTVTGTISGTFGTLGTTMSGTYVSSDQSTGDWSASEGALTNWNLSFATTAGPDKGKSGTGILSLVTQSGGDFIGVITAKDGLKMVSGTISSSDLNMIITHYDSYSLTLITTTVTGTVKSGTFGKSGCVMAGTWTDDAGDSGSWNAKEK
jgi:hypothetical protein